MSTVFAMVKEVLADSKEKLASRQAAPSPRVPAAKEKVASAPSSVHSEAEKVAAALDYMADNLGLLVDTRTPSEKLAEYVAVAEALTKQAEEDGAHQTQEAPAAYQPPMVPSLQGGQPGAGANQLENFEAQGEGPVLEPGGSGEAPASDQPPMTTTPTEATFPGDQAANAFETNDEMKVARATKIAQLVASGQISEKTAAYMIAQTPKVKIAGRPYVKDVLSDAATKMKGKMNDPSFQKKVLAGGAVLGGTAAAYKATRPKKEKIASAGDFIRKLAEDALNPAQISAGTTPALQTAEGANPAQSQGTPTGEGVSAPGITGISSNTAAINATKEELKGGATRREMAQYLNAPAFTTSGDSVLQQSLENAAPSGVKIAAATKVMLEKWASGSPERTERLHEALSKVKRANEMMGYGESPAASPMGGMGAAPPAPAAPAMPPMTASMPGSPGEVKAAEGMEPVSDAALAAAAQGVDPEELMRAEELLMEQMGGMEGQMPSMEEPMPEGVPPEMMGGEMPPEAAAPPQG